jgi:hypothetical protein
LPAAVWLAVAETAVLIVIVGFTRQHAALIVIAFLAVKFPFCWLALRLSPGAYLGLVVWEVAGAVAALGASGTLVALRLLEIAVAAAVIGLLIASTPLFPSVRLPESPNA